jgi:hypothetical protein
MEIRRDLGATQPQRPPVGQTLHLPVSLAELWELAFLVRLSSLFCSTLCRHGTQCTLSLPATTPNPKMSPHASKWARLRQLCSSCHMELWIGECPPAGQAASCPHCLSSLRIQTKILLFKVVEWLMWKSTGLASMRPWVETPVPSKKKKNQIGGHISLGLFLDSAFCFSSWSMSVPQHCHMVLISVVGQFWSQVEWLLPF